MWQHGRGREVNREGGPMKPPAAVGHLFGGMSIFNHAVSTGRAQGTSIHGEGSGIAARVMSMDAPKACLILNMEGGGPQSKKRGNKERPLTKPCFSLNFKRLLFPLA